VTDKIKILHLTSTPSGIGGVERLLLDMAPHYNRDRFCIAHCNLFDETGGTGAFPTGLRATGLPVFEIAGLRWHDLPRMVRQLRRLVRQEEIDVLHLHMVHATIIGGLAAFLPTRAKVVVSKHYLYSMLSRTALRVVDRFFTNRADAVAAVSKAVADDLERHGIAAGRDRVIHNGIDLDAFDGRSSKPASVDLSESAPLLASFGNLHPRKGHEYAVMAMPDILREHPTARLMLVGEGPRHAYLEALAKSLGIQASIMMRGFEPNVPALMLSVDVCVHPSLDEPFGIALLEAMAAGKPVVATSVDGIPEIIEHGANGLLVPPRDPKAIADAVLALLRNEPFRERTGAAGRARVEREFTIQETVRSYEALYEQIVGRP